MFALLGLLFPQEIQFAIYLKIDTLNRNKIIETNKNTFSSKFSSIFDISPTSDITISNLSKLLAFYFEYWLMCDFFLDVSDEMHRI